jgi:hypothetical protein
MNLVPLLRHQPTLRRRPAVVSFVSLDSSPAPHARARDRPLIDLHGRRIDLGDLEA